MSTPPEQPLVPPSPSTTAAASAYPHVAPSWPQPGAPQAGWPQAAAPQPGWGTPAAGARDETEQALRKARTALGWAIGATVGAFLAMAIAVAALLVSGSTGDDYGYEPLRGEVVGLPVGSALGGDRLKRSLDDRLRELGAEDVDISCPDTAAVTVSTAVVCSGAVDGYDWTGIVFFEDTEGGYVVVEM